MSERDPFENYRKRREIELMEKQFQVRAEEQRQRVDDLLAEEEGERSESENKVDAEMEDFLTESVQNAERMIENMYEDGEEDGPAPRRLESQIEDFFASVGGKEEEEEEARESLPPEPSVSAAAFEPPPLREPSPLRSSEKLPPPKLPRPPVEASAPRPPPPPPEPPPEESPRREESHEEPPQPSVVERRPLGGVEEKPKKTIDLNAALDRIRRHVKAPDDAPLTLEDLGEQQRPPKVRSGSSDFLHRLEGGPEDEEADGEGGVGGVTNRFQADPGEDRDIDDDVDTDEPPGWNIPVRPPPPGAWVVAKEKEEGQSGLAGAAGDTYLIKKLHQEVRNMNRVYLALLAKGVVTRDEVEGDGHPTTADDDDDEGVSVDDLQDERYRPIDTSDQNFSLSGLVKDVHRLKMLREVLVKKGIVSQKDLEKAKG